MRYRKLAIFAAVIFIVVLVIIGIGSCVKMAKKGESRKVRDQETQNVPIRIELDGSNSTEEVVLSGKLNDVPSGRLFRADLGFLQMCQSL